MEVELPFSGKALAVEVSESRVVDVCGEGMSIYIFEEI